MIELVAIGVAVAVGFVAGGLFRKKPLPAKTPPNVLEPGAIGLGDVLVLEDGRGKELWLARELALKEGEGEPFLRLFEADGPARARAVVAFDPRRDGEVSVLEAQTTPALAESTQSGRALPSTLEVQVDGEPVRVSCEMRISATGATEAAPEVEGEPALPRAGDVQVATYRGGARGYAVVLRASGETQLYAGRSISLSSISVMPGGRGAR